MAKSKFVKTGSHVVHVWCEQCLFTKHYRQVICLQMAGWDHSFKKMAEHAQVCSETMGVPRG